MVEGTPPPSTLTASRSARATALNDASRMWWALRPLRIRMCSVMAAEVQKARQNSSASWGSKGGSPRGTPRRRRWGRPRKPGTAGPDRSRATSTSASSSGTAIGREAPHPGLVPERLPERLAQYDPDVLDGVVSVDGEVPRAAEVEVKTAVTAQLREHVVEEGQPRRHFYPAVTVELEVH